MRRQLFAFAILAACKGSSPAPQPGVPPQQPVGTEAGPSPQPPTNTANAQSSPRTDDVFVVGKTSAGAEVVAIGEPRMRLADDTAQGGLELRVQAGIVAAEDAGAVTLFDAVRGVVMRRIAPLPDAHPLPTTFALSSDGALLAVGSGGKTRVFSGPGFERESVTAACSHADAFSQSGKLLACDTGVPEIWNTSDQRRVAKATDAVFPAATILKGAAFAADERGLYLVSKDSVVLWDFAGAGAAKTVFKSNDKISRAVFSEDRKHVLLTTKAAGSYKFKSALVDLQTGQSSPSFDGYKAALSPSGDRAVVGDYDLRVVDTATGKDTSSAKADALVERLAYSPSGNAFAYAAGRRIHLVDDSKEREYAKPSRFVRWLTADSALIDHNGKLEVYSFPTKQWSAPSAEATKRELDAPAWATWIATDRSVLAEPSARSTAAEGARDGTPCPAKLRVWTAKGQTKTLTMKCSGTTDPGWRLGGGAALSLATRTATLYDVGTGKSTATFKVESPIDKPELARELSDAAISTDGKLVAIVSRGARVPSPGDAQDPREDALHVDENKAECAKDLGGECELDYFVSVYAVADSAKPLWSQRLETTRGKERVAIRPSVLSFEPAGKRLLVGTSAGEIQIRNLQDGSIVATEALHHGPVTGLSLSVDGTTVMSEDAALQQRAWSVPR